MATTTPQTMNNKLVGFIKRITDHAPHGEFLVSAENGSTEIRFFSEDEFLGGITFDKQDWSIENVDDYIGNIGSILDDGI